MDMLTVLGRAGGGGKTKFRTDKIKEKNVKLKEARVRKMENEKVAKAEKEKGKVEKDGEAAGDDNIHPSRKQRVPQR